MNKVRAPKAKRRPVDEAALPPASSQSRGAGLRERKKARGQIGPAPLFIALVHHPVTNKRGDVVATSITTFDLHDLARSSITFGVKRYFVLTPLDSQRHFASRIIGVWQSKLGRLRNWTREEAFQLIAVKETMTEAINEITREYGEAPYIVGTSARKKHGTPVEALRRRIETTSRPILILFGTGYGMTPEVLSACDEVLEPIESDSRYNHLSVRSAVAIYLHGLKGRK